MKRISIAVCLAASVAQLSGAPAAPAATGGRTINNLPNFPKESLRRSINRPLYRSLQVSPVDAWVVARASLYAGHTAGAKIIHSEANGVYDKMLVEMANGYSVSGTNTIESRVSSDSLTVHLLIYKIADGLMGICFSNTDDARYLGYKQSGSAWVGAFQNGKWTTISRPEKK